MYVGCNYCGVCTVSYHAHGWSVVAGSIGPTRISRNLHGMGGHPVVYNVHWNAVGIISRSVQLRIGVPCENLYFKYNFRSVRFFIPYWNPRYLLLPYSLPNHPLLGLWGKMTVPIFSTMLRCYKHDVCPIIDVTDVQYTYLCRENLNITISMHTQIVRRYDKQ